MNRVELHDGDLIQIGDFALIVELSAPSAASRPGGFEGTLVGISMPGTGSASPGVVPDIFDLRTRPTATVGRSRSSCNGSAGEIHSQCVTPTVFRSASSCNQMSKQRPPCRRHSTSEPVATSAS